MVALEHPFNAKVREITIEVAAPEEPPPPPPVLPVEEPVVSNQIPFFVEAPPATVEVTKTDALTGWSYKLPEVADEDEDDTVEVTCNLGASSTFADFDASARSLQISDLSDPQVLPGNYTITFTLDDSKDTKSYSLILTVNQLEPETVPLEEEASHDNSTSTETNSTTTESVTSRSQPTSSSFQSVQTPSTPEETLKA